MFAVIGEISDKSEIGMDQGFLGEMWFAGKNGAKLVPWEWTGGDFYFLNVGNDKYIVMYLPSSNWYPCFIFGSRNSELYYAEEVSDYKYLPEDGELNISAIFLNFNDNGELIMTESAYDCTVPNIGGHSWKEYWFYYDEEERKFKEYGGVELSLEQFMTFSNAEDVIALVGEEQEICSVIYRENGIINVNLSQKYSFESPIDYFEVSEIYYQNYITVRFKDKEIYQIDDQEGYSVGLGAYLPALIHEIATYPDVTGLFD